MIHEPSHTHTKGIYVKVPNSIGLYRHAATGRYYAVKKLNGHRRERSLRTTDRKIAERRMKDWINSLDKTDTEVEKTTIKELTARLIAMTQAKSESTQYVTGAVLRGFMHWSGGNTQVRDIRPSRIDEWLVRRGRDLKNTSFNRIAGVIKQFFEVAVSDRIIAESPFDRVRARWRKPQTPIRRVPTVAQFEAIITNIRSHPGKREGRHGADFLEFLGLAGLGQAEAAALTWGDVDWQRNLLRIRRHKTDSRFSVPIYAHLRPLMERLMSKAGGAVTPNTRVFKIKGGCTSLTNACRRLGYHKFTQRNLRQCLIMRLWKSGVDRKVIARWQGHKDGGQLIINTYTEVFGSDDDEYERQQLAKLLPAATLTSAPASIPAISMSAQTAVVKRKSFSMDNPYKAGDKVLTNVKGVEVAGTVVSIWQNEVQVKTDDGKDFWRTMHTVWFPFSTPMPKPPKIAEIQPPVVEPPSSGGEEASAASANAEQPACTAPELSGGEPATSAPGAEHVPERTACEVEPKRPNRDGKRNKRGKSRR